MASSTKYLSIFLLFTAIVALQSEAREPKFFSKASATVPETTKPATTVPETTKPEESDPNFLPESENGYGLYGKDPSSAAVKPTVAGNSFGRQLPDNYNSVAYVTGSQSEIESRDEMKDASFPKNQNYYMYDEPNDVAGEDEEGPEEYKNSYNYDSYNPGGGSKFSSRPQGLSAAASRVGRGGYFPDGVESRPQGMSDTRSLENGKYFYDLNREKYSDNHPFEALKASSSYGNRFYSSNRRNYGNMFAGENSFGRFPSDQENEYREEGRFGNLP